MLVLRICRSSLLPLPPAAHASATLELSSSSSLERLLPPPGLELASASNPTRCRVHREVHAAVTSGERGTLFSGASRMISIISRDKSSIMKAVFWWPSSREQKAIWKTFLLKEIKMSSSCTHVPTISREVILITLLFLLSAEIAWYSQCRHINAKAPRVFVFKWWFSSIILHSMLVELFHLSLDGVALYVKLMVWSALRNYDLDFFKRFPEQSRIDGCKTINETPFNFWFNGFSLLSTWDSSG